MNAAISQAVAIFRKFPHASDDEILRELIASGIDRPLASRLVEFLPMAYCRLILKDAGVRFSDYFQRKLADGRLSPERPLSSEPLLGGDAVVCRIGKAKRTSRNSPARNCSTQQRVRRDEPSGKTGVEAERYNPYLDSVLLAGRRPAPQ